IAYFKKSEFETAIQDLDQAVRLRPDFLSALVSRGFAHLRLKKYDSAITAFDAALGAYPGDAASLYGRALARVAKGDRAGADAEVDSVRRSYPTLGQELATLGLDLEAPPELVTVAPSAAPASTPPVVQNAAPRPAEETALLPPGGGTGTAIAPPREPTAAPPAPAEEIASLPLPADVTAAPTQRGTDLLRPGDVAAARLAFERAAAGGNEAAAMGVAKTYDPIFLAQSGVRGLRGDAARAALWYGKAVAAGSREAQDRLARL